MLNLRRGLKVSNANTAIILDYERLRKKVKGAGKAVFKNLSWNIVEGIDDASIRLFSLVGLGRRYCR